MVRKLCILFILANFVNCATVSNVSLEDNNLSELTETVIYENGRIIIQNNDFVFIATLVNDLNSVTEFWWSVPYRQEFPDIPAVEYLNKGGQISLFLVYSSRNLDINLTYEFWTEKPDGSETRRNRLNLERGLHDNNLVNVRLYRDRILEIERGNIPRNSLFKAGSLPTIRYSEDSLYCDRQDLI
jgi:hypothetical protein